VRWRRGGSVGSQRHGGEEAVNWGAVVGDG
jgi:hypothetical protein